MVAGQFPLSVECFRVTHPIHWMVWIAEPNRNVRPLCPCNDLLLIYAIILFARNARTARRSNEKMLSCVQHPYMAKSSSSESADYGYALCGAVDMNVSNKYHLFMSTLLFFNFACCRNSQRNDIPETAFSFSNIFHFSLLLNRVESQSQHKEFTIFNSFMNVILTSFRRVRNRCHVRWASISDHEIHLAICNVTN